MTCNVLMGTLNSTHSLTHSLDVVDGSMGETEQLSSAAVVGEVTSHTEPRTAVLGVQ